MSKIATQPAKGIVHNVPPLSPDQAADKEKSEYTSNQTVEITDPQGNPDVEIGEELSLQNNSSQRLEDGDGVEVKIVAGPNKRAIFIRKIPQ